MRLSSQAMCSARLLRVLAEYRMFLRNKSVKGLQFVSTDDERIFRFIEEIEALPRNNQLIEFRNSDEIAVHLREQWAGLFQRFLQEQEQLPVRRAADELRTALKTVNELVTFLTNDRREQGSAINEILLVNHPIFERLRKLTATPYPIFFRTRSEMAVWLGARNWTPVDREHWDDSSGAEWIRDVGPNKRLLLTIAESLFDDNRLRVLTAAEWKREWVTLKTLDPTPNDDFADFPSALVEDDDDLPF